jgi:hypothetical protein
VDVEALAEQDEAGRGSLLMPFAAPIAFLPARSVAARR